MQLNSTEDSDRNLETADRLVREAASRGAELVVLPEKWSVLGTPEQMNAGAQPLDGPGISWARATARELGIDLVAGSILERIAGQHKGANTSVHVGPDGELRRVYRKIHMFDVEVDGVVYAESDSEQPGAEVVVSQLADGTPLGMSICYDVRFPELYRILAVRGAEVIAVPSAFTLATTRDLDDDHLHQLGVVSVGIDDEGGNRAQFVPRRALGGVGLGDRREHHVPPLEEERVEDLLLRGEVVIDEAVGDPRLVGDVGYAAGVKSLPGEHAHGGVENHPPLVDRGARCRGHQISHP